MFCWPKLNTMSHSAGINEFICEFYFAVFRLSIHILVGLQNKNENEIVFQNELFRVGKNANKPKYLGQEWNEFFNNETVNNHEKQTAKNEEKSISIKVPREWFVRHSKHTKFWCQFWLLLWEPQFWQLHTWMNENNTLIFIHIVCSWCVVDAPGSAFLRFSARSLGFRFVSIVFSVASKNLWNLEKFW